MINLYLIFYHPKLFLLDPEEIVLSGLGNNPNNIYSYVRSESNARFQLKWLEPLGFTNTYALMVRKGWAIENEVQSISDLAAQRAVVD